ncbi:MAG: glycosyltransferase, partial [Proteobacteria bacterium]|nr:glycosyltransferase [Pseudomonadota bacterium]
EQLQSILIQTFKPYKILINIDQSSDKTEFIIQDLAKTNPEIQILNSNKRFGSAASNFIHLLKNTDLTEVEYIALADQDDLWKEDKLEKAIQKLKQGYDGYSSNVEAFWDNGQKKTIIKNQPQLEFDHLFESAGPGCTFVMTKKLAISLQEFLKGGQFNQLDNFHDWLIYAYARSNDLKWYIDSYPGVEYRQHNANVFGANVGIKAFVSRIRRVLNGEGFDFAFLLMKELNVQDPFIQSLFPVSRINLLRLAFQFKYCRRRWRDQTYFFFVCILLAIIFPKKLRAI